MKEKYRIILAVTLIFLLWRTIYYFSSLQSKQDKEFMENELANAGAAEKVKLTLYYEALCPDSKYFVSQHLLPTFTELQDFLLIDFIPYGKAETIEEEGKIEFQCQHFEAECEANKIHACAIDHIHNQLLLVKYIACMISNNILPVDIAEKCAQELNIDFSPIGDCSKNDKGTQLLKYHGERTHSLLPPIVFIPTIELNGSQNIVKQSQILKDLHKSICQLLRNKPPQCI